MKSKEIAELALSTVDVGVISPKIVADTIDKIAKKEAYLSQVFTEIDDYKDTTGRKVEIPKFVDYITVSSDVAENTSISPSSFSYQATTVQVAKFGVRAEFGKEAMKSATRDLVKDALYLAGLDYAVELDKRASTVLLNLSVGTIDSWSGGTLGTVTAGQSPIVQVLTVGAGTVSSVDYYDGKILLTGSIGAGTVTYTYSNSRYALDSTGKGTLSFTDILALRSSMCVNSTIYPSVLFVTPTDMVNFMKDTIVSNLFNSNTDGYNGKVGEILDISIVKSCILPVGNAVFVDPTRVGYSIIKRDLEGNVINKPEYDSIWYQLWGEKEYAVSNTLAIGLISNIKSGQYSAANI